jgi:hypothetical protein
MKVDKRILIAIVAVIIIVAVAAIGAIFLLADEPSAALVKNDDYVLYDVSVNATYVGQFEGYMNITFHNVTANGCDVRTEINIPEWNIANSSKHLDGLVVLTTLDDLGELRESNIRLNTTFGPKQVDQYTLYDGGVAWHSWCGSNPLVQYKISYAEFGVDIYFIIHNTSVDSVKTGNSWQ